MTTRREVLQMSGLSALGALGLARFTVLREGSSAGSASQLAPQNTPVPYAGVFRRRPDWSWLQRPAPTSATTDPVSRMTG